MLDHTRYQDVFRSAVRQLDPVVKQIVRHPKDLRVDALTALLNVLGSNGLFSFLDLALNDPVVSLRAVDLAPESQVVTTTHLSEPFYGFGDFVVFFFTKVNSSPVEHLCILLEVGVDKASMLNKRLVIRMNQVVDLNS